HSFKREGVVRAIGISVRSPQDGLRAVKKFGIECVQVNFNMTDQRAIDTGLWTLCERQQVGVIVRTPLCFGFLTGKYSGGFQFDASDHRSTWSRDQIALWAKAHEVFSSVCQTNTQTPVELALRFCLSYPVVSTVIPGMLNNLQVEENVRAGNLG